tara:strand:+ start:88 stop:753 length:666 start_codon:yes stop_codon:yes gene_type:complete
MSTFKDASEMSDADYDDEPLSNRAVRMGFLEKQWHAIPGETDFGLTSTLFIERAYKMRGRAEEIFEYEKQKILNNTQVSDEAKAHLRPYSLIFDGGTRRRGVCKYPSATRRAHIGLSARMVDNAVSAKKIVTIIRHELSHACNPGQKHNNVWKEFDRLIGGDAQRCCTDEEVKKAIGHRIEVVCPNDRAHFLKKMQKAPTRFWLQTRVCKQCKSKFNVFRV